jgi:hypothetical protein
VDEPLDVRHADVVDHHEILREAPLARASRKRGATILKKSRVREKLP